MRRQLLILVEVRDVRVHSETGAVFSVQQLHSLRALFRIV